MERRTGADALAGGRTTGWEEVSGRVEAGDEEDGVGLENSLAQGDGSDVAGGGGREGEGLETESAVSEGNSSISFWSRDGSSSSSRSGDSHPDSSTSSSDAMERAGRDQQVSVHQCVWMIIVWSAERALGRV